jgi:crotonobetainyl-CoA:carnitine CoA-transferase CaiB-like acyl-CoA transferase
MVSLQDPVVTAAEVIAEPHLEARGFWDTVEHPDVGTYRQVSTPWQLSKSPRQVTSPAPGLGDHNGYVLRELLGLSTEEIQVLAANSVIGTQPIEPNEI